MRYVNWDFVIWATILVLLVVKTFGVPILVWWIIFMVVERIAGTGLALTVTVGGGGTFLLVRHWRFIRNHINWGLVR